MPVMILWRPSVGSGCLGGAGSGADRAAPSGLSFSLSHFLFSASPALLCGLGFGRLTILGCRYPAAGVAFVACQGRD